MGASISRVEQYGWVLVMAILVSFAIPWFMWGTSRVVAGLPLWLWWHICWLIGASLVFALFTQRAWGIGITGLSEGGEQA